MIPYVINTANITFFINGRPYTVGMDHPNADEIKAMLLDGSTDTAALIDLADIPTAIQKPSDGKIEIRGDEVFYRGASLDNVWTTKLISFMQASLPFQPVLNALESLMRNPSMSARNRLPLFVEKNHLGFLPDGRVVGLKAVRADFKDKHSGTVDNTPGVAIPRMDRADIDDDPNTHCSHGYHVGTWDYVADFGRGNDRYLLCAFWPEDVVAVPTDKCTKVRLAHYETLQELPRAAIDGFIAKNHNVVTFDHDDQDGYSED